MRQFITKGDNNKYEDPKAVLSEQIVGRHIGTIPFIGWPGLVLKQGGEEVAVETGAPSEPTFLDKLAQKYIESQADKLDGEGKGD